MNEIGQPIDRVDGRLKVTGAATYSAEFPVKNLCYGVTVQSAISHGRIVNIDSSNAEAIKGVLGVLTYKNSMSLHQLSSNEPGSGKFGERDLLPLQTDRIFYNGQHIAVVIAESFEIAEQAARMIKVTYDEQVAVLEMEKALANAYEPKQGLGGGGVQTTRGDIKEAIKKASGKIKETYITPVYHHNPIEPHATIAEWKEDKLTIYDSTQAVLGSRNAIAQMLGMPPEKIHLMALFIGGGFGCKGFTWPHSVLAPMAAKHVGRPVKIVLDRQQMFTGNGRRSRTIQDIELGAAKDGKLVAVQHVSTVETSFVDDFVEQAGIATKTIYAVNDLEVKHKLIRLHKGTPCPARAPGEAPGTFALEVAMDELAVKLKMDPIQLRIINHATEDMEKELPFSEKNLLECYKRGAEAIGWSNRNPEPRSIKENGMLVGYGMATATYPANRSAASAKVEIFKDGQAVVSCCTQDLGTGTYTVLAQIAADTLGIPVASITVKLGDSLLPKGPNSGGSQTSASAGPAVQAAAKGAKTKIINMAISDSRSPLFGLGEEAIAASGNRLYSIADNNKGETYTAILNRLNMDVLEEEATTNVSNRANQQPTEDKKKKQDNKAAAADEAVDRKKYSFHSFGAQFVKVLVHPVLGTVKVVKCVGVMDVGKVLNLKTAKNQIMGGMVFAIGMALMEETVYDGISGRVITKDLANYRVPVHADMPEFDIQFIDRPDPYISPIGSRGIGEIGITGMTAAIANAVYHATGKRIRNIPVTPDKLL